MKKVICFLVMLISLSGSDMWALSPSTANVVILGDSNSWIGGDDCSKPKGWNYWFKKKLQPSSCKSYARSGATWSHTPSTRNNPTENIGVIGDDNVISNQIVRLQQAVAAGTQVSPDVIIIAAGTNDLMFPRKRPSATAERSDDNKTVVGAITSDCQALRDMFPKALIVVMTPIQCVKFPNENLHSLSDKMETASRRVGAEVIRMDRNGAVKRDVEIKKRTNTYDGIHTSEAGGRANGEYVAQEVEKLICNQL